MKNYQILVFWELRLYLNIYLKYCTQVDISPDELHLKYCIAISCADITASTNTHLIGAEFSTFTNPNPTPVQLYGVNVAIQSYATCNLWNRFKMNIKYLLYRKRVLQIFNLYNNDNLPILD